MNFSHTLPKTSLLVGAVVLLIVAAAAHFRGGMIDLHAADTFYVISSSYIYMLSGGLLLLLWIIYRLFAPWPLKPALTWLHIVLSLAAVVTVLVAVSSAQDQTAGGLPRYMTTGGQESSFTALQIAEISLKALIIVQVFLLGNLALSMSAKRGMNQG